ncbi:MAG: ThuA domain-containing protein [Planctomycetaceae bacterium]|nr:ThuA domain-containing protein [Planctomycetaceae bacterium]
MSYFYRIPGIVSLILIASAAVVRAAEESPDIRIVPDRITAEQKALMENAVPTEAVVKPKKARKLLIFDINADYGGHGSIPYANHAFTLMGQKTGAFEAVVSRDPQVFQADSLKQYDAVFFNNNVGNIFSDPQLRRNVADFVRHGGGLMGVHGTTAAFLNWSGPAAGTDDWPQFGEMIGGRGANHREMDEKIFVKVEEPHHPLLQWFPKDGFEYQDEFFRVSDPYSREKQRVLLSIDKEKTNLNREPYIGVKERADEDYALAWVKSYGQGRCFYSTIAHSPKVFWDPAMLKFYLAAAQFVLGDLDAPTLPSAFVNDTIRAHEKAGWRLAMPAYTFHQHSLFDTIDKTAELGLRYCGGLSFQKVGGGIDKFFDPGQLNDEEIAAVNEKLKSKGIRMVSYYYHEIPGDEAACRKVFEFAGKIGIETFLSEPKPENLPMIERFCNEFGVNVALHNHDEKSSPEYWHPEKVLAQCEKYGPRIGVCGDLGYWMRSGVDPVEAARILKDRLMVVQVHDLDEFSPNGTDVLWGTGIGKTREFFGELYQLGVRPLDVDVEYSLHFEDNMDECRKCIEFFNETVEKIVESES